MAEKEKLSEGQEAIKYHRSRAESAETSIGLICVFYFIVCFLVVAPELSTLAADRVSPEETYYGWIKFFSEIEIELEKLKFLLTTLPILFGVVIAGLMLAARHHYGICSELYKMASSGSVSSADSSKTKGPDLAPNVVVNVESLRRRLPLKR